MKNDILTEERIDNYILGKMTAEQKAQFESDMQTDQELKSEYEAQKEVAGGVQRVALRQFLADCEQKRLTKVSVEFVGLGQTLREFSDKVRKFAFSGKRLAWSFSAVAAMVVAVVGVSNYSRMSNSLQDTFLLAYSQTIAPEPRNGNELDLLLESVYVNIGAGQFELAESQLKQADKLIEEGLNEAIITEEDEYNHRILSLKHEDSQWYSALMLMKHGKVLKAKKALSSIAESGSCYSQDAQELSNKIYHSK